ncbi:hypothetical protein C8R48DRAFT_782327 [Suillus tomentosus]|nr:hypothetical protein C8R48DRAFT_782327 [Suillus tomentosus]
MPITLNSNSSALTERKLRTINVVNPFYVVTTSSDSPTSNLHFSTKTGALFQWPLSPTTSSVSWMHSRQITPPSRSSTKRCKSPNVVAYSCLGLHAIAPLLSNAVRGWDRSTFSIIPQQASDWDED